MGTIDHPKLGKIRGTTNDDLTSFQGVPFARIPRRFARSTLLETLPSGADFAGYDATRPGPSSIQSFDAVRNDPGEQSIPIDRISPDEGLHQSDLNCLNLNITVPTFSLNGSVSMLPVLVFLHGGAFLVGAGDRSYYDPENFLRQALLSDPPRPIILVTANYRLGTLGYLHSTSAKDKDGQPLIPPNNGFHDQARLFEWVKEFIKGFGGDPQNITTIGQSAGSESLGIHNLLSCYADKEQEDQPYRRSILFSGSLLCMPAMNPEEHEQNFYEKAVQLGVAVNGRTSSEIAQDLIDNVDEDAFRELGWCGAPCLQTDMLPYPAATLDTILRVEQDKPMSGCRRWVPEQLISSAEFDGGVTYHLVKFDPTRSQAHGRNFRTLAFRSLPSTIVNQLLELYSIGEATDDDATLRAINQLETDLSFILPTIFEAMAAEASKTKTYLQFWRLVNPFPGSFHSDSLEPGRYANHTYDIVALFGAFEDRLDEAQRCVVQKWRTRIIEFIHFGGQSSSCWQEWTEEEGTATVVDLRGTRTVAKGEYLGPKTRLGKLLKLGEQLHPVEGLDRIFSEVVRPYLLGIWVPDK